MGHPRLERYIDDIEAQMLGNAPSQVVEYEGEVNSATLLRSCELLSARYPVLRAKVRVSTDGCLLYVPAGYFPEVALLYGDENSLQCRLREPWDPRDGVVQFLHLRQRVGGFVAMRTDHVIADGTTWKAWFYDLWRIYTDLTEGREVSIVEEQSLHRAPSALLADDGRAREHRTRSQSAHHAIEALSKRASDCSVKITHERRRLEVDSTARLFSRAHERDTTVHGIVCGAILVTMRDLQTSRSGPMSMICRSVIDLRNRAGRNIGATSTANFLGLHQATVDVPQNADPILVGKEVKRQLDSAIEDGVRMYDRSDLAPSGKEETATDKRRSIVSVANSGVIPSFAYPDALKITDWWGISPTVQPETPNFPSVAAYTYAGRLNVLYLCRSDAFSADEVADFADRTENLLNDISRLV